MKVHIICRDWTSDRILARLARLLVERLEWSIGKKPDPKADVNYAFPYLELGSFAATPTVAWFTHREETIPRKAQQWEKAASGVGLRLTSAGIYAAELVSHGPTTLVTPPLDREKFRPKLRAPGRRPVLGVSGWVYPGGRKGEHLVQQLATDPEMKFLTLKAAGEGWPIPTEYYHWSRLEAFYQSLDVYLCTSLVEGIPYPPLEALACGVNVVIPRGVGLLDELPDIPGIERYEKGDYNSMRQAIERALGEPGDPWQLRAATERFTADAWVWDHVRAIERWLEGDAGAVYADAAERPTLGKLLTDTAPAYLDETTVPASRERWQDRAGVYVVAYGDQARSCAERLIESVRREMDDVLPVCLASDAPLDLGERFVANADEDIGGRSVKTKIYDLAPAEWEYVVYLDADTELVAPIDALLAPLTDGWDLVITHNPPRYALLADSRRPDNADELAATLELIGSEQALQLNGGVFAFRRSERTDAFFRAWHEEWQRWGKRDQLALLRALWRVPLRVWLLGREFNATARYDEWTVRTAIKHYPLEARRWRGLINGRLDSTEAWAALHPETVRG